MKRIALLALGTATFALAGCSTTEESVAEAVGTTHQAEMTGAAEVPGPGDPDGTGRAEVSIVDATDNLCYEVKDVANLSPVVAAHIHRGAAGEAGPPVVPLIVDSTGRGKACAKIDGSLADDIKNNPAQFHVNLHTADFPAGAIRGQLHR